MHSPSSTSSDLNVSTPKVSVLVNVTPTPGMMLQLHLLACSLRQNSGIDYELVIVWDHGYSYDQVAEEYSWLSHYPHRQLSTPEDYNDKLGYVGNFLYRFEVECESDVAIIADADTIVVGELNTICAFTHQEQAVLGVPAGTRIDELGAKAFEAAGLSDLMGQAPFMPWGIWKEEPMNEFHAPPHYNCGFMFMTPRIMNRIGDTLFDDTKLAKQAMNGHPLHTQIGISLSLVRTGEPYHFVNPKYNMTATGGAPLPGKAAQPYYAGRRFMFKNAVEDIRVVHYCASAPLVDKKEHLRSYESLGNLAQKPMGTSSFGHKTQNFLRENLEALIKEAE